MYSLLRKAWRAGVDICKGVDEIEYVLVNNLCNFLVNNSFNLYYDGLQEIWNIKHLKTLLVEDEIVYRE